MIYGIGIYDGNIKIAKDGKKHPAYQLWYSMLQRCYGEKFKQLRPAYKACTAAHEFHRFSTFIEWASSQIGYGQPGFQIDKDLLLPGNKVYGPDFCLFLPRAINMAIQIRRPTRELPVGVYWCQRSKKFKAQMTNGGSVVPLGSYNTPEEAFAAYKPAKEEALSNLADFWKGQIDLRAYAALKNFRITIED